MAPGLGGTFTEETWGRRAFGNQAFIKAITNNTYSEIWLKDSTLAL